MPNGGLAPAGTVRMAENAATVPTVILPSGPNAPVLELPLNAANAPKPSYVGSAAAGTAGRAAGPSKLLPAAGSILKLGMDTMRKLTSASTNVRQAPAAMSFTSLGTSQGEAFRMQVMNNTALMVFFGL